MNFARIFNNRSRMNGLGWWIGAGLGLAALATAGALAWKRRAVLAAADDDELTPTMTIETETVVVGDPHVLVDDGSEMVDRDTVEPELDPMGAAPGGPDLRNAVDVLVFDQQVEPDDENASWFVSPIDSRS